MALDSETRALVRLAARIANGSELDVRDALRETKDSKTPSAWVVELLLQSYLFCGFPRALNAVREWRRISEAGGEDGREEGGWERRHDVEAYRKAGESTCAKVYGRFYERLRQHIVELHPLLDDWMIVEGYGKVLSRPGLDLARRELCTMAACVASGQDRQVHSHLHGCRNVGVPDDVTGEALEALADVVEAENLERARAMWGKVRE